MQILGRPIGIVSLLTVRVTLQFRLLLVHGPC